MKTAFYLEVSDGEKYTWISHSISKEEEIDWLLEKVKKTLNDIFLKKEKKEKNETPVFLTYGRNSATRPVEFTGFRKLKE
jgi:hypothetical protein